MKYSKLIFSFFPFLIFSIQSQECNALCQKRIRSFLENPVNTELKTIGTQILGMSLPPIAGNLKQLLNTYQALLIFYTLIFGITDNNFLNQIDYNASLPLNTEKLKENIKKLNGQLGKESPPELTQYNFMPIGSALVKSGKFKVKNNSDTLWNIQLSKGEQEKYQTIKPGETTEIPTNLSEVLFFIPGKDKEKFLKVGSRFPSNFLYDNDEYEIKKEKDHYVLTNTFSNEKSISQKPIVINAINSL